MLDYKIKTFLTLCETLNYRRTAELLNMTQPSVTNHIQLLENEYNTKLFTYNNRVLSMTDSAKILESYGKSMSYNEKELIKKLKKSNAITFNLGASLTIGHYIIAPRMSDILKRSGANISLTIDNTTKLLSQIENSTIDIAVIEGYFDKTKFDYRHFRNEKFVGICKATHPFANKCVKLSSIFNEKLIIRESGSGTRKVFENILYSKNHSLDNFLKPILTYNSFDTIALIVESGIGVSFVYESVAKSNDALQTFTIESVNIINEFNYVFLKNTSANKLIQYLL